MLAKLVLEATQEMFDISTDVHLIGICIMEIQWYAQNDFRIMDNSHMDIS